MPCMTCAKRILVLFGSCAIAAAQGIQPADLWKQPVPAADHKLAYGQDALQFGELRLPKTKGPYPVVILVHGGCYVDRLPRRDPRDTTFEPLRPLAAALAEAGSLPGISNTGVPEIAAADGLAPFSI